MCLVVWFEVESQSRIKRSVIQKPVLLGCYGRDPHISFAKSSGGLSQKEFPDNLRFPVIRNLGFPRSKASHSVLIELAARSEI